MTAYPAFKVRLARFIALALCLAQFGCGVDGGTQAIPKSGKHSVNGTVRFDQSVGINAAEPDGKSGAVLVEVSEGVVGSLIKASGEIEIKGNDGKVSRQSGSVFLRIVRIDGIPPTLSVVQSGGAGFWAIGVRPVAENAPERKEGQRLYFFHEDNGGGIEMIFIDIEAVKVVQ